MSTLAQYLKRVNPVRKIFGDSVINPAAVTEAEAKYLFERLDSDMSPEALHMDGERPAHEARQLAALYTTVFEELKTQGFVPPKGLYHF